MQGNNLHYPEKYRLSDWLPVSLKEVQDLGWEQPDIILFSGDAYVDHPSFGAAVIGRVLENQGYRVAIIPQPNWRDDLRDFRKLGKPRLFFGITAGNMDSMINHYTANRRLRSNDAYSIGNQAGFRPDRALSVYAGILRKLFPESIIIAGGIEASLRRLAHYDYWDDLVRPSILADGAIDYLVYGNGEKPILDLARKISDGAPVEDIRTVPQIAFRTKDISQLAEWPGRQTTTLGSYENSLTDKIQFARDFRVIEEESNMLATSRLAQMHGENFVVVNPPYPTASSDELDSYHDLPYTRLPHPRYWKKPIIPAFEMIRFSVNIHRGCFGGCTFCTISAHQGKHIASRSQKSVLSEIGNITRMPGFKGYVSDVGGPSANMYGMQPFNRTICQKCRKPSCIYPGICKNLNISHKPILSLYRKVREVQGIKKAFVGSGVRYDLFLNDRSKEDSSLREYPAELIRFHVSGRLKVAPEHTQDGVLKVIRKPGFGKFLELKRLFDKVNEQHSMRQELIPYFISSHPGCTVEDMAELAAAARPLGLHTEQVQDLTPTPMTLASVMFHTGLDPYTMKPVYVARNAADKLLQRSFFFTTDPEEKRKIIATLKKIGREDLIPRIFGSNTLKHVKEKSLGRRNR